MLGSLLLKLLSVFGLFFFSVLIFFEGNLCLVWFFLELAGLSLIPSFFSLGSSMSMVGLFYYLIMSGVSSGLLLSGVMFPECVFLMILGLLMKFGVFPFFGWVYSVLGNSGWVVMWGFSTILKSSFVLISFFLMVSGFCDYVILVFCCLSCLVASMLFWVFSVNWKICWVHMVLSSSAVLVYLCFSGSSLDSLVCVFFFYVLWSTATISFFYLDARFDMSSSNYFIFVFGFCFLLLSLPLSFSIFYKISVCMSLFSCGLIFLMCWLFYNIAEQFYFLFVIIGYFSQKSSLGFSGLV